MRSTIVTVTAWSASVRQLVTSASPLQRLKLSRCRSGRGLMWSKEPLLDGNNVQDPPRPEGALLRVIHVTWACPHFPAVDIFDFILRGGSSDVDCHHDNGQVSTFC